MGGGGGGEGRKAERVERDISQGWLCEGGREERGGGECENGRVMSLD